jgi:hypothetical protein
MDGQANKRVQFGYGLNYLIDIENAVIVDVEATPARTYDEVAATQTMLDRTEGRFNLKPKRLAADTAYGTGKFLGWLVKKKKITPHIPVWEERSAGRHLLTLGLPLGQKARGLHLPQRLAAGLRSYVSIRDGGPPTIDFASSLDIQCKARQSDSMCVSVWRLRPEISR